MKFKIFSILSVVLCCFLAATATLIESDGFSELESLKLNFIEPLPKLIESSTITRYYNLELKVVKLSPDGYERPVWTANGQFPAPLIQANKGDRLVINVTNNFGEGTAIHWHGIFQRESNWYDGVPGQTQCPIPDGVSFIYNYALDQSGTYWYHSHFMTQYVDGFVGPLIILDPDDPYKNSYQEDYVVLISDWYHSLSSLLLAQRLAPHYLGFSPYPDSVLISGLGQYNCSSPAAGENCNPNVPLPAYNVQKGKKYRFRIINTSALALSTFSIDNHPLSVIEVDGIPVKRAKAVNILQIHVAQRYSVILTANQPVANYYIRASIIDTCLLPRTTETINYNSSINYNATGILHYYGAESNKPTSTPYPVTMQSCGDLDPSVIRPYNNCPAPTNVTNEFVFNITFDRSENDIGILGINFSTYIPTFDNPTNQRIIGKENYKDFEKDQNAFGYDIPYGCVQITVLNNLIVNHPFHLHGHTFWLVASGPGPFLSNITTYNLENPVIRDTTNILPGSHIVIRYLADNPGVWAFHCHIEWHVSSGLVAQLIERPSEFSNQTLPEDVRALCSRYKKQKRLATLPRNSMVKRVHMYRKVK
ncbi:hypothetical protein Glove_109g314 [Diversispora epigaea]|uniref:Laccase n=1 Tax=Diversispora epigaea TaxID=1348612 RepID=A0A397J600_9GLOM|nr:hypothetical protein Glove_109g314 [Diversispora epigaea]